MNHISGKPRLNACLESIYSTLKVEINLKKLVKTKTPQQIKTIISKWIRFYNTDRHHSKLNTTPKAYRNGTPL